jgi:hypothetical protein
VPHAAVVGQALSAANALDVDPPSNWPDLLGEAIAALERRRQGRFGIGGDPSLLVAVLCGLDAAHMHARHRRRSTAGSDCRKPAQRQGRRDGARGRRTGVG